MNYGIVSKDLNFNDTLSPFVYTLLKSIKEIAIVLNTTYKSIADLIHYKIKVYHRHNRIPLTRMSSKNLIPYITANNMNRVLNSLSHQLRFLIDRIKTEVLFNNRYIFE
jgi:hypothetical protein